MVNTPALHEVPPIPTEPVRNIRIGFAERETEETPTKASNSFHLTSLATLGFGEKVVAGANKGTGEVNQ